MLEESLQASHIAVCVKNANKEVLEQNELCKQICGDSLGEICERGCMALYAEDDVLQWKDWGARVYKNSHIHDAFFDVTLLLSGKNIITFLQPLKDKYEQALAHYQGKGLTRRETEVVSLTIRGDSNIDICQALSISKATLRTHLNNIYRKLRDLGEEPAFIPANRVSA